MRLKEANMINKSLTTLGAVINDLAERSNEEVKAESMGRNKKAVANGRHIRYRESKLTRIL